MKPRRIIAWGSIWVEVRPSWWLSRLRPWPPMESCLIQQPITVHGSEVRDDSLPSGIKLTFPVIDVLVASQNAVEMVELTSEMDQNHPNIDTYAAGVQHNLPEDEEVQEPAIHLFVDVLIICLPLNGSILTCIMWLLSRLPWTSLSKVWKGYCQRRGKIQSHRSTCNGCHHIRMDIHTDIPSCFCFGKFENDQRHVVAATLLIFWRRIARFA